MAKGRVKSNFTQTSPYCDRRPKGKTMNKNDVIIRLERKEEEREVETLVREAFWNVYRPGCLEHMF